MQMDPNVRVLKRQLGPQGCCELELYSTMAALSGSPGSALAWAFRFGRGNELAADATSGHLALELRGRHGWRIAVLGVGRDSNI